MTRTRIGMLALLFCQTAMAGTPDITLSLDYWDQSITGKVQGSRAGDGNYEVRSTYNMKDAEDVGILALQVEHPLPLLPNLRLATARQEYKGASSLATPIRFDGVSLTGNIESRLNLDYTDIILYGTPLDTGVKVNVGGGLRLFDGEMSVTSATQQRRMSVDTRVPVAFVQVSAKLPAGFRAEGEMTALGMANSGSGDIQARLAWESSFGLGVRAGYHIVKHILRRDVGADGRVDVVLSGPFAGLYYHF